MHPGHRRQSLCCLETQMVHDETPHDVIGGHQAYTAISRKVVGKSARDNPERHYGWF